MPPSEFCPICYVGPIPSKGDQAKPDSDNDNVAHQPCDLIAKSPESVSYRPPITGCARLTIIKREAPSY